MISMRKKIFVMFFLLKIGHYNNINKHFHYFLLIYFLKVCCLKATLYHNGQIETFDIFMQKKKILIDNMNFFKHLNRLLYQIYLVIKVLHISYLIKSNISYPAFRQRCSIVDCKCNQTFISVIISKHYNQCCFKVKK